MVTTIIGTNSYARQQSVKVLVSDFIKKYGDIGYEHIDGENIALDQLRSSLQSIPFLSDRKLVVLQNPSTNKEFVSNIDQLLSAIPDSTDVIIVESKIDKRLHYYAVLKGQTKFRELQEPVGGSLVSWLISYVQDNGGQVSPQVARNLIERVGINQQRLANELDKLLLYNPAITDQSIQLLVEITPQSSIFEMLDSALTGNNRRTLALYKEQRALKIEPPKIIAMLTWQLHILALIKTAPHMTAEQIAQESRQNTFVIRKSLALADKIDQRNLKQMLQDLLAIDTKLKTDKFDPDEALQYYLLTLHQNLLLSA
jgi:DNA polymerase-3 subunit delta